MLSSAPTSSQHIPVGLLADSAFRSQLLEDPVKALADHGIDLDPSTLPAEIRLPSAEALDDALSADPGNGNGGGQGNGNGPPTPTNPVGTPIWAAFVG